MDWRRTSTLTTLAWPQDPKNAGVPLLTVDLRVPFIQLMKRHIKPQDHFTEIAMEGNTVVTTACGTFRLTSEGIDEPTRRARVTLARMDGIIKQVTGVQSVDVHE